MLMNPGYMAVDTPFSTAEQLFLCVEKYTSRFGYLSFGKMSSQI